MTERTPNNVLAQEKPLTVDQEMSRFKGFTTNNGITVDPKAEEARRGPGDRNLSPEEEAAGVKVVGEQPRGAKGGEGKGGEQKPAKVELTDEEKTAAIDGARTLLKLKDDEELTEDEEAEALAAALTEKKQASKPGNDRDSRVKRAQDGRRRAEARAARAEGKLSSLEQRLAALEAGGKPLTPAADGGKGEDKDQEPQAKDFELGELDPKYIRALARWEVRQELAENSKNQQTRQTQAQKDAAAAEYTEKKAAFEDAGLEAYDDFQEVVMDTVVLPKSDPAAWPLSATVGRLLLDSKFGPHIAYALASDPKEAKRVDKLSPADQQRWFFRQEAKLESEHPETSEAEGEQEEESEQTERPARRTPEQPQARISKAPPPPARRSNGGGGNRGGVSPATQDFAAFEALANGKKDR